MKIINNINQNQILINILISSFYLGHIVFLFFVDITSLGKKYPGLEKRDYSCRGSAALTMRHPSIRKSWL
jgi:hypothetical protein